MPRPVGEQMLHRWMYALVGLLALLVVAPSADAGAYSHYACMYPNGRGGAPLSDGTNGWRAVGSSIPSYTAFSECDRGGAFGARLTSDSSSHAPDSYGWRYEPPVGTSVTAFSIALAGYANPDMGEVDVVEDGGRYLYRNIRAGDGGSLENPIVVGASGMTGVPYIWASCDATDCTAPGQRIADFHVFRARVDLSDAKSPTGSVAGAGAEAGTWSGTQHLDVSLQDSGGGVY